MGTNRRKAVKEKFGRVAKDRRIKARRERKQAKKVADRLLGKVRTLEEWADGQDKDYQWTYKFHNSKTGITTNP